MRHRPKISQKIVKKLCKFGEKSRAHRNNSVGGVGTGLKRGQTVAKYAVFGSTFELSITKRQIEPRGTHFFVFFSTTGCG